MKPILRYPRKNSTGMLSKLFCFNFFVVEPQSIDTRYLWKVPGAR
jgi:hypothetical protein